MSTSKTQDPNLEDLDKAALDKEKVILEIKNLTDAGQSKIEIFMKRRIIPVFLPFLTLLITIIFFFINWKESEKGKALDRYKSEVDMVKMVWPDMKNMDTASQQFKISKKFLIGMFNANSSYYLKDSVYLGIGKNQRPIMVLTNMNPDIQKAIAKIEKNNLLAEALQGMDETPKVKASTQKPKNAKTVIATKAPAIVEATNNVAGNALKVYIQYSSFAGKDKTQFLANQLKPYYIVPPIDYIGSKSDDNEIRYYTATDLETAKLLAKRIKDITGLEFRLKNIQNNSIKNTIEIWYCNASPRQTAVVKQDTAQNPQVGELLFDQDSFIGVKFKRQLMTGFTFYVDAFDTKTREATFRVNNSAAELCKQGVPKTVKVDNFEITITVQDYKTVTFKKAVYFHAKIVRG
jgi:hypothetical protein